MSFTVPHDYCAAVTLQAVFRDLTIAITVTGFGCYGDRVPTPTPLAPSPTVQNQTSLQEGIRVCACRSPVTLTRGCGRFAFSFVLGAHGRSGPSVPSCGHCHTLLEYVPYAGRFH
jgi:hypothetical protein